MPENHCPESVSMEDLSASKGGFNVKTAVRIQPSSSFVVAIITSSIIIIFLQFVHIAGLLYADYLLMINTDTDYIPLIYLEAVPGYLMAALLFLPFCFYNKWISWLLSGQNVEDVDVRPGITILGFVHTVGLNILIYTVQILVILVQMFYRHLARIPSGNRCSCYQSDLSYLTSNKSLSSCYKCVCYAPSLPVYTRRFHLITDDLTKLTPDTVEIYTGADPEKPFTELQITEYSSEEQYEEAYARQRFSYPYTVVIIVLICNLIILAIRMPLWIKLKELWMESEKHYMAKRIKESSGCLQNDEKTWRACILSACEVTKKLKTLDKAYREKKTSNIRLMKDEFTFAFLEGADAFGLFVDTLSHAYVNPDSPTLSVAVIFICIDTCLFNWDNLLLAIPVYGERVASYVRTSATVFINLPFFAIRLALILDERLRGFSFLMLALFLMKEVTAFILSSIDLVQMIRDDWKKRRAAKTRD